jgi:tetratricopeptide (TPR) repeat protein
MRSRPWASSACSPPPWTRRRIAAWLIVFGCVLLTPAARCDESGGTRSVFASGAGTRALALGGAYVAIADDASALLWNAGALGSVERMEVQLAHAGNGELGSREEYGAFVLPSWRWGVAALAVQHFAMDGIDARDERNVPLGDLSDAESEITLGFGRALGPALGVGGAVKVQRQSLAGYSGSGLGADLGVLLRPGLLLGSDAPWAEGLTLGLSLRNAVAPSLRLDRESVPDPSTARFGFAYRHAFLGGRSFIAAVDLEQAGGIGPRLHSGLEVDVHPLLTLRAGMSQGSLTAGTSVRWRDLAFDYAFEDGDVEAVHRIGISRAIGPTTGERREAAARAEERAILARVDAAERQRLERQVAGLMTDARAAMASGDFDGALEILGTLATIAPGHAEATALEATCLDTKAARLEQAGDLMGGALAYGRALALAAGDSAAAAGERRCRAESDRRAARSAEIRRVVATGMDALAADDLPAARDAFTHVLALDANDREAAAMLERVRRAIATRAEGQLRLARRSLDAGSFDQAAEQARGARVLDPRAEGLDELEAALARARGRSAGVAAGVPAPDTARAGRAADRSAVKHAGREVEDLYRRGLAAIAERRLDDALRYWELVQSLNPGDPRVTEYLKREYLTRGMEHFAAGRVEEAMSYWQKALDVDPKDERARGYMARAQTQVARTRELTGEPR